MFPVALFAPMRCSAAGTANSNHSSSRTLPKWTSACSRRCQAACDNVRPRRMCARGCTQQSCPDAFGFSNGARMAQSPPPQVSSARRFQRQVVYALVYRSIRHRRDALPLGPAPLQQCHYCLGQLHQLPWHHLTARDHTRDPCATRHHSFISGSSLSGNKNRGVLDSSPWHVSGHLGSLFTFGQQGNGLATFPATSFWRFLGSRRVWSDTDIPRGIFLVARRTFPFGHVYISCDFGKHSISRKKYLQRLRGYWGSRTA